MNDAVHEALNQTLQFLLELARDDATPREAMARFRLLQQRFSDVPMDLVWEEERPTHTFHYDVLLHVPPSGTISLSFSPDRAVPWALRHVHHSHETDIVRVNGKRMDIATVMACIDYLWDEEPLITQLVDVSLLRDAIEKRDVQVSDEELQEAMDAFRQRHELYKAADFLRWLEERGITQERLEQDIENETAFAKLRDQIAEGRIEDEFARRASDFDTAYVARFRSADEETAQRIYAQIRRGELDFFEAAQRQFLAGEVHESGRLFAILRRGEMSPELARVIFAASPGEVVTPMRSGDGYDIVRVLQIVPSRLDEATREVIKEALFAEWLAEQRQSATIEWFWGDTARLQNRGEGEV